MGDPGADIGEAEEGELLAAEPEYVAAGEVEAGAIVEEVLLGPEVRTAACLAASALSSSMRLHLAPISLLHTC
jgi:hypothetical protein